jgi:hypothetical protein
MRIIVSIDSLDRTSYVAAVELMNRFIGPNDEKVYKAWKGDD